MEKTMETTIDNGNYYVIQGLWVLGIRGTLIGDSGVA